jgi:hypothetical protein
MDSERGRDADAPPRFLGDYPDGAYWTADRPADADRQEPEDHTVKGPVIRFMWDYGVTVPMWDAEGQLPEEPEWLRTSLGLSDGLIDAVIDEGREMNRLDGAGAAFTEEWRARYAEADTRGRSLAE